MANVVSDLLASSVFHVGTFIVATARHGSGDAQALYRSLERWAVASGATFMRLGVVQGNARAERFWASEGYVRVRDRPGIPMGPRTVTVQVMVKPIAGGSLDHYVALVPRDRTDDDAL
jgi:predicted GNAT superfamily acetyltransferase